MIATQDVLHLLWEMEQKALHLWLPERHEPIPGYVLAWQGNPITDAQRNDRGFWSEALLADTRELGEGVHSINWVRLPPEIREDVDVLRYVAQLWCAGINVDWAVWYGTPLPQRGSASAYPFAHNHYPLPGRVMGSVEHSTRSRTRNAPPLSGTSRVKRTFRSRTLAGYAVYHRSDGTVAGNIAGRGGRRLFELGGHSLLVTQLTSRLERDFNVHIDLLTLMENPNPRNIYAHIAAQLGAKTTSK